MHKAEFWAHEGDSVRCMLCPHRCLIREGKTGICRARKNIGGDLFALSYSEVISVSLDPIEKKPLYHFLPGSAILSVGPRGCNFSCSFCQNWQISQSEGGTLHIEPQRLVDEALMEGAMGIAYTYTEPIVAFEFVKDTAIFARSAGLKNVLVTNGFVEQEPLAELIEFIDAMNIDLKSMSREFYQKICGGSLGPVLKTIREVAHSRVHLELTYLIIPGYNDTDEAIASLVDFVAEINRALPLHFSGYHPAYRLFAEPTPTETLLRAKKIADKKLDFVYIGNRATEFGRDTLCPNCGNLLVSRQRYSGRIVDLSSSGECGNCGRTIKGFWGK